MWRGNSAPAAGPSAYLKAKFLGRKPCCSAWRSSCATLRTFNRRIRLNRCTSTVRTLISRRRAMSRLVFPCDTSLRISFCRGVRPSERLARADTALDNFTGFRFFATGAALVAFDDFFG